jgi:4-coumarate--CoA ligase (photoactive yellow protein activation family)
MTKLESPLLDQADFIRLTRAGAVSLLTRAAGFPSFLPPSPDAAGLTWPELGLAACLPELHSLMAGFFSLPAVPPPAATETLGGYAERLWSAWLGSESRAIVFTTSGSTGQPQPHRHTESLLRQEAEVTAEFFMDRTRVVTAAPVIHSYGFIFGLLVPKLLGIPAVDLPPLPTAAPETWRSGDLLVAYPLFLERLCDQPPPQDLILLSATAPCPERFFQTARERGFAGLREIYGASETGAVGLRLEPGPFNLLKHWRRAGGGRLARTIPEGGEEFYPQMDKLRWRDPRHFTPMGRLDKAVQVAGVNVYPARVAELISEHPQVEFALVRPMTEEEGGRLKAYVIVSGEASPEIVHRELMAEFRRRLSPPERPAHITFGKEPPRSALGKVSDWKI